ncbi:hypothetical protein Q3G72_020519 [Acer saccharum]|nr:hypothetical protein Q3G72_020519 [Acer saccharum]
MVFSGSCKGPINFNLQGDLVAPTGAASLEIELWISFQYIDQLTINGGGSLDGQGPSAWPFNKYDNNPLGKPLPIDSGVKINDIWYNNIYGTTPMQIAETLNCSVSYLCWNVKMKDINIALIKELEDQQSLIVTKLMALY